MIFYFDAKLNLIKNEPESVFQGSNKANTIYFIAPFSSADSVTVKFTLPDGKVTKVGLMTNTATLNGVMDIKSGETYSVWVYAVPQIVTAGAGTVTAQFSVYANEVIYASQSAVFTVNKGVAPALPETPTEDVYTEILSALTDIKNSKPISEVSNVNIDTDLKKSPYIYACSNVTGTLPSFIYSDTSFILEVEVGKNNTDSKYLIQTVKFETLYAYRKKYGDSEWSEWTEIKISTGIDTTEAEKGQVLGFDGEKTVWETPAAVPIKSISGGTTDNIYEPDSNGNVNIPLLVKNTEYTTPGLVKLFGNFAQSGLRWMNYAGNQGLQVYSADDTAIKNRTSNPVITVSNLNKAVIAALSDSHHITLTDEQKTTVQEVLGIPDSGTKLYKHSSVGNMRVIDNDGNEEIIGGTMITINAISTAYTSGQEFLDGMKGALYFELNGDNGEGHTLYGSFHIPYRNTNGMFCIRYNSSEGTYESPIIVNSPSSDYVAFSSDTVTEL